MLHEFRQDPVSGDWVLFSTERGKKPAASVDKEFYQSKDTCPFEPERVVGQETPVAIYSHGRQISDLANWTTVVIPNKYPAVKKGMCGPIREAGLFSVADGTGFHELVVTRDHERSFAQFSQEETSEVIGAYRDRYRAIAADDCGEYISIFHNHGRLAGASVYHAHSQILSIPVVPPAVSRSLAGAQQYFDRQGRRIHDDLLSAETKEGTRIVYENERFVVLCPYASRSAYELNIFPKTPNPSFGTISDEEIPFLADALNTVLKKLFVALDDIDYTFFINTAPPKQEASTYQWHIEILPRISIEAGLELETNIKINTVDPDEAAKLLRETLLSTQ